MKLKILSKDIRGATSEQLVRARFVVWKDRRDRKCPYYMWDRVSGEIHPMNRSKEKIRRACLRANKIYGPTEPTTMKPLTNDVLVRCVVVPAKIGARWRRSKTLRLCGK